MTRWFRSWFSPELCRRTSGPQPGPYDCDDELAPDRPDILSLAAEIGRLAASTEASHDRDASFVAEAYDAMAERGYLALAVPSDLGGGGAGLREVVLAELELGRRSGPAALAAAMHLYLSLVQCWRRRRGARRTPRQRCAEW
jgi:alkylation response protein AidB-like acyl-CoA dehydrogenase